MEILLAVFAGFFLMSIAFSYYFFYREKGQDKLSFADRYALQQLSCEKGIGFSAIISTLILLIIWWVYS